jgi:hypothetical protein
LNSHRGPQDGPLRLTGSRGLVLQGRISASEAGHPNSRQGREGTLTRPQPIELPLLGRHQVRIALGYEEMPSSWFWTFTAQAHLSITAQRSSDDPAQRSVAVALLDGRGNHVRSLVEYANGGGSPLVIPPGRYLICATLHVPENVTVQIELDVKPAIVLRGLLPLQVNLRGAELKLPLGQSLAGKLLIALRGAGCALSPSHGRALLGRSLLALRGGGALLHGPQVMGPRLAIYCSKTLQQKIWSVLEPIGAWFFDPIPNQSVRGRFAPCRPPLAHLITADLPLQLRGHSTISTVQAVPIGAAFKSKVLMRLGHPATIIWRHAPLENWPVRFDAASNVIELNRAYVNLSGDPLKVQQQLDELKILLGSSKPNVFYTPRRVFANAQGIEWALHRRDGTWATASSIEAAALSRLAPDRSGNWDPETGVPVP